VRAYSYDISLAASVCYAKVFSFLKRLANLKYIVVIRVQVGTPVFILLSL
jgi:hypothetical protein